MQGGGRAIFNFDAVLNVPEQKMGDTPKLAALVSEWGITPNGDVILDLSSASRLFGQISPVVGSYEHHPIVNVMQDNATVYPIARSLEVKSPAEKLFSSTAESYSLTNPKLPIKESDLANREERPVRPGRRFDRRHWREPGARRRGGQFQLDREQHHVRARSAIAISFST